MTETKVNTMLPRVVDVRPTLGCDPEFFFKDTSGIIGAEKIIPKDGLLIGRNKFIIDGVQAELNPEPNTCRQSLLWTIQSCFQSLQQELKKQGMTTVPEFSRAVEISKEALMELDEKSRKFGCAPSESIYRGKSGLKIESVDPSEYRVRAAGGHIHFGHNTNKSLVRALTKDYKRTVAMLDLICGNTMVLVDRDPANIERRKVYGKAGEFRLPPHGLEYRTLSNFWLTAAPLMSLAFGMARLAVQLMADDVNHELFYEAFTSKVKAKNVRDAINNNDFDLAMKNFKAIAPLIFEVIQMRDSNGNIRSNDTKIYEQSSVPIDIHNIKEFYYFVDKIQENGLKHWFPKDPMTYYITADDTHMSGFNEYLKTTIRKELQKDEAKALKKAEEEAKKALVVETKGITIIYADKPKVTARKSIKKVA